MFIGATNITLIYFFLTVGPRSYLRMKKHAGFLVRTDYYGNIDSLDHV